MKLYTLLTAGAAVKEEVLDIKSGDTGNSAMVIDDTKEEMVEVVLKVFVDSATMNDGVATVDDAKVEMMAGGMHEDAGIVDNKVVADIQKGVQGIKLGDQTLTSNNNASRVDTAKEEMMEVEELGKAGIHGDTGREVGANHDLGKVRTYLLFLCNIGRDRRKSVWIRIFNRCHWSVFLLVLKLIHS